MRARYYTVSPCAEPVDNRHGFVTDRSTIIF